jgi:hypothetical protein
MNTVVTEDVYVVTAVEMSIQRVKILQKQYQSESTTIFMLSVHFLTCSSTYSVIILSDRHRWSLPAFVPNVGAKRGTFCTPIEPTGSDIRPLDTQNDVPLAD